MKIGIEAQRIFRKKKHGMEVVTIELINHLQKIDKENEYIIFVKDGEDRGCIKETENFKIRIVPGITYPDWEQIHLPRAIKKENLDLIHFTSNTASVFTNTPIVLTLHDIIYLESISFSGTQYQNIGNIYRRLIVPKIVNKSKAIITVSEYEKERIDQHFSFENDKVKVVYNAKDSAFKKVNDEDLLNRIREKYNFPDNFILFLGNTAPKKNSDRLIRAYARYVEKSESPLPLVVLDLPRPYIVNILKELGMEKIDNQIITKDYISHNDLLVVYNLATIFIYPSLRESFGLPIIEAMACGTPVITSNTSAMPEVAGNAALLANPYDVEDMAEKIHSLATNEHLLQSLIEKGYKRSEDFSWERTANKVLEIYNNVLYL